MNKKAITIVSLLIYLASAGISYFVFSGSTSAVTGDKENEVPVAGDVDNDYEAILFDPNEPKTEECPINGAKYSKTQRKWWESHRPLGIMVENHEDSRPQSGLNATDVIYEAVAEGGITRFLAVYYCQDAGIVGPVRSARTYYLDWISEYGEYPLYAHVGGANTPGPANALGQIDQYGWGNYNDLNQFAIGFPIFRRDDSRLGRPVATEHTMYTVTSKLWEIGKERGLTNEDEDGNSWDEEYISYKFKDDAEPSKRPTSQSVNIQYWNNSKYFVDWDYDRERNVYLRKNGGEKHNDRNTNEQFFAKNLVVLFMSEGRANDGYEGNVHIIYGNKGTGKALVYIDGKETKANWKKSGREGRTIITDSTGSEIKFNRGKIWFNVTEVDGVVTAK
jgi:hypothetical protein